jgi:hypothetical protein
MADFGGEMRFTFNARPLVMRAAISYNPTRFEFEGMANQDNSPSRTMKPTAYNFEVTFEDAADVDWDAVMLGGPYNVTVVEDTTGTLHMWTKAQFTGRPSVNRESGEVSGIAGIARSYKKTGV